MSVPKKIYTVEEAISLIEMSDEAFRATVYMEGPDNPLISDEDSADEDEPEANINHLSGNQLLAPAHAFIEKVINNEIVREEIGVSDVTKEPFEVTQPKKTVERLWKNIDITSKSVAQETKNQIYNYSPVQLFELFFDEGLIGDITNFSNSYAVQKGNMGFVISPNETRGFIGILLLSGYNQVSRRRMYWEENKDTHNEAISSCMSRNRFDEIIKYFHVCDNHKIEEGDRFGKIRPLFSQLNEKWLCCYNHEPHLAIDEAMVPYFGRHGAKQHLHGKPIRFGYKIWCICTRLGYLVQCEPYQGAKTGKTVPHLGLGGSVILDLVSELPIKCNLYFDNFFTSIKLLQELKERGHYGTGTIRSNRTENAPLIGEKLLKKKNRGSYNQITDANEMITLVRYHDNNVVTLASTQHGVKPVQQAKRWSAAAKKKIMIDQPFVVAQYNKYMGGVDRLDENISKLRINIRSKKWYWPLICFAINASVNNAWQLYRQSEGYKSEPLDQLQFTRQIVLTYLMQCKKATISGRPRLHTSVSKRVPNDVRLDGHGHLIVSSPTQIRCGNCKKNTTKKCKKCNVGCHANCFEIFHS